MRQAFHEYLEMLFIIFVIVFVGKKKKFVIIYFPDDKFRLVFMENSGNSDKLNNCRLTRDNHIDSSVFLIEISVFLRSYYDECYIKESLQ